MKCGWVYIITNSRNTVFYVGVTSNLKMRVLQHRKKQFGNSFTAKYWVNKLVYYRQFDSIQKAIKEEKRIKGGSRAAKIKLIELLNPDYNDLYSNL